MDLRFDTSVDDVRRQYRKLSLAVHPDKCKHPQAAAAFDGESYCMSHPATPTYPACLCVRKLQVAALDWDKDQLKLCNDLIM